MAKKKSPSELDSRTVRINVGDYIALKELAEKLQVTMAEAFREIYLTAFKNSGGQEKVK